MTENAVEKQSKKAATKPKKEKKPTDKLADKTLLTRILQGVFGDAQKKILKRMYKKTVENLSVSNCLLHHT